MRKKLWWGVTILALLGVAAWLAAGSINLSALDEPGRAETYLATKAKHWLIGRAAKGVGPAPARAPNSAAIGGMQFRADCAACHGTDGRQATDTGRWMYPRASDLGSPAVQQWSDAELFWIIKNGIRLTGMPGFGKVHPDDQLWHVVSYVRQVGEEAKRQPTAQKGSVTRRPAPESFALREVSKSSKEITP